MQVQLKQIEIIAALKQFITSQGINLSGKDVNITFTAGRKEAGIIADVSIEDVSIPGFSDSAVEGAVKVSDAPALSVVPTTAAPTKEATAEVVVQPVAEPVESDEVIPVSAPVKTTSLFN